MTPIRAFSGAAQLARYERTWLRPDVVAGVTVAAYLVPQVMAYAQLAGLDPVAGYRPGSSLRHAPGCARRVRTPTGDGSK